MLTCQRDSCRQWQLTGIPCTHAICYIGSLRNEELDKYVHDYYSMKKFQAAYAGVIEPMTDKSQWPTLDLGFKLWPPVLKRSAGRPREQGGSKGLMKEVQPRGSPGARDVVSLVTCKRLATKRSMILMHHRLHRQSLRGSGKRRIKRWLQ